jgi:hypothetical protein
VPGTEEGGAEAELQYVEVIEDTEGTQANLLTKASPGAINPVFKFLCNYLWMIVHLSSRVDMKP